MARARPISGLAADTEFTVAAARIVAVRAAEVAEHSRDVLDVSDIERVHDMRVATRRLRAALEVFEACFPKKPHRVALREVKALADALGERRDRDVTIALFENLGTAMPAPDRAGVASLVEQLRAEQAAANEDLVPFVTDERLAELDERLAELVGAAEGGVGGASADHTDGGSAGRPGGAGATEGNGA
jgi:CHAD domain-containing protein